ncbi:hypothetical protein ACFDTO_38860 [Microbacteriaceae bacterium 4G12]
MVRLGLILGLVMDVSYLAAGTVTTNPTDVLLGVIILAAGFNAGRSGEACWVILFIRKTVAKENKTVNQVKYSA